MGIEWGGRTERPKHLPSQNRFARFLHRKPGGLRGVLETAIDTPREQTTSAKVNGPIEMPDAQRIPASEQVIDALTSPGAHHAEMRSAQDAIHAPNPLERLQRQ